MDSAAEPGYRRATEADLDSLLEMEASFYAAESYPFDAAEARTLLAGLMREPIWGQIWVVEYRNELAGYFILTFGYSIEFHGIVAIIDELYVQPEARGLGLGKRALESAERACIDLGIRSLHLVVEHRNVSAQELYRRSGFKGHDRHLMTKHLPRSG